VQKRASGVDRKKQPVIECRRGRSRRKVNAAHEAALAFAITMLALSLMVSSFVEIIHRIFSMREAGLKYVLGQMLDQVLDKHIRSGIAVRVQGTSIANKDDTIKELVEQFLVSNGARQ
jgi:hypothetical protein